MRYKLLNRFCLALSLSAAIPAFALDAVLPEPYVFDTTSGTDTLYLADNSLVGATAAIDTGFTGFNATVAGSYFYVKITGIDTTKKYIHLLAASGATTVFAPIEASTDSTNCGTTLGGFGDKCVTANGSLTEIWIRFDLKNICSYDSSITGCNGVNVGTGAAHIFTLHVVSRTGVSGDATDVTDEARFRVKLQANAPTITCPTGKKFFPGDGSVIISTDQFIATTHADGTSPSFQKLVVVSTVGTPAAIGSTFASNTIVGRLTYRNGDQEVGGFQNVDIQNPPAYPAGFYNLDFGVRDSSGAIGFAAAGCAEDRAFSTNIQGLLKESNCFIATASFRSSRAASVMLLREFRNEILLKFDLGKRFVSLYNELGPIGADWLIAHPEFRPPVLAILMPIQVVAWLFLNPEFSAGVLFLALFFVILSIRARFSIRTLHLSSLFLAVLFSLNARAESSQPYIDSLLSTMPKEEIRPTDKNPQPYIDSVKKKLGNEPDPSESYSEKQKRYLGDSEKSEGYTEYRKKELGKDEGSAIADFKSGKQLKPNKGDSYVRGSFGFKLATAVHREYLAGSNQDRAYSEIYGTKWVPDLTLTYEMRPIKKGFFSGLGLYSGLGASFIQAKGKLEFNDSGNFISDSKTNFKFITIPFQIGARYHMNWFNVLYPYFGGGPAAIGFIESRSDAQDGNKGYSLGYWGAAGINLGLDWLSGKSSWERYESTGTKHAYISLEYSYMNTIGKGLIDMSVDGLMAGFNFEF